MVREHNLMPCCFRMPLTLRIPISQSRRRIVLPSLKVLWHQITADTTEICSIASACQIHHRRSWANFCGPINNSHWARISFNSFIPKVLRPHHLDSLLENHTPIWALKHLIKVSALHLRLFSWVHIRIYDDSDFLSNLFLLIKLLNYSLWHKHLRICNNMFLSYIHNLNLNKKTNLYLVFSSGITTPAQSKETQIKADLNSSFLNLQIFIHFYWVQSENSIEDAAILRIFKPNDR